MSGPSPREKLANQLASVLEMQRRKQKIQDEGRRLLASHYPGGLVSTPVVSFTSPQFSKVSICLCVFVNVHPRFMDVVRSKVNITVMTFRP